MIDPPTTDPVISLMVPVHDAAAHLPHLFEVLRREAHPDAELIFVDDASTDATAAMLRDFQQSQTTWAVQIVTLPENSGAGVARRAGLAPARGRYLMWLDVDDDLAPGALDIALTAAATSDPDTILVFDYRVRWAQGQPHHLPGMTADTHVGAEDAVGALLRWDISPFMWNKAVPRHGLTPDHFATRRNGQDWLTMVNLLCVHPKVRRVPEVLVDYVQQPGTLSRQIDLVSYSSPDRGLTAEMATLLRERGLWGACQTDFLRRYSPRINANAAVAAARWFDPGPQDPLALVAANTRRALALHHLVGALRRGDRPAAGALVLLRISRRLFRRLARRSDPTKSGARDDETP